MRLAPFPVGSGTAVTDDLAGLALLDQATADIGRAERRQLRAILECDRRGQWRTSGAKVEGCRDHVGFLAARLGISQWKARRLIATASKLDVVVAVRRKVARGRRPAPGSRGGRVHQGGRSPCRTASGSTVARGWRGTRRLHDRSASSRCARAHDLRADSRRPGHLSSQARPRTLMERRAEKRRRADLVSTEWPSLRTRTRTSGDAAPRRDLATSVGSRALGCVVARAQQRRSRDFSLGCRQEVLDAGLLAGCPHGKDYRPEVALSSSPFRAS